MIKVILWDVDGTLLDFEAAEKVAIRQCFASHDMGECTDEMLKRYSAINKKYWEALERGELTKPEVLVGRFREFFESEGLPVEKAESFNEEYQVRLGDTVVFCDNAFELVLKYKGQIKQYAVTNGTKVAQDRKLKNSKLDTLFDGIFISDVLGVEKPNKGFFDIVFDEIGTYEKDEVLIVGDSLTSDIKGGNNAGILTCWYNPKKLENTKGVNVNFAITNLWEVEQILQKS
ncbi:MAG: YjjG family noncanonical pyrimidine nucleotidase [Roseburia sp.]|nr:YjjG family noncanonical pyrimidine nucleotidase [Roseburia sp.]